VTSAPSRGLLRGTAAESFERFRLGYPDEVVDRTLAYADIPVRTAVEVEAGTGKATRAFASRGVHVTALEPDIDMYAVLEREAIGMSVEPVLSSFEKYDGPKVDLVYAAAAWDWTDPLHHWTRAVDMLVDGGVLALFSSPMKLADQALQAAIDAVFRRNDQHLRASAGWLHDEMTASRSVDDVEHHVLAREVVLLQREYVGFLSTIPDYAELPMEERQDVLRRIACLLPPQVLVDATLGLHLARTV
jgi:trans-aconitate methyltransferase